MYSTPQNLNSWNGGAKGLPRQGGSEETTIRQKLIKALAFLQERQTPAALSARGYNPAAVRISAISACTF